jgi:acyl carrier protein
VGMAAANTQMQLNQATEWSMSVKKVETFLEYIFEYSCFFSVDSLVTIIPKSIIKFVSNKIKTQFSEVMNDSNVGSLLTTSDLVGNNSVLIDNAEIRDTVLNIIIPLIQTSNEVRKKWLDDDQLMENGLDSLGATELAGQISKTYHIKLLPTFVFNYPTINSIVQYLATVLENPESKNHVDESDIDGAVIEHFPIFSNYINRAKTAVARMILFPSLGQPSIAWNEFAKVVKHSGIDVHIVRLPGYIILINIYNYEC